MKTIVTLLEINAPAGTVWDILCDFASYPDWNPYITHIEGEQHVGARLAVTMESAGQRAMTVRPKLIAVENARELRWRGHLFVPGIFDAEHLFALEPLAPDRTLLRQEERFTGILPPFAGGILRNTERSFVAMNQALKERAEESLVLSQ